MPDPIDIARRFVSGGTTPQQIDELLVAWGEEGRTQQLAATQVLFETAYGYTYERQLRVRAASALLAFGVPGLKPSLIRSDEKAR